MSNRQLVTAYVCLGSNLGDTDANLAQAIAAIDDLKGVTVTAVSPIYRTEPQEKKDQPWFANQVISVECDNVSPESLITSLLALEAHMGRNREGQSDADRFGPRVIDLDVLMHGNTVMDTELLILPHPRMHQRAFVMVPLRDIAPELTFPNGKTLVHALESLQFRVEDDRIWQ